MYMPRFPRRLVVMLASILVALLCGSLAAQVPVLSEWAVPVTMKFTSTNETFNLEFGKKNGATDGFNAGIDVPAPPVVPGGSDAYLFISVFPNRLEKDFRNPADTPKDWTLRAIDATGFGTNTLSWNTDDFPIGDVPGVLTISSPQIGLVNMLAQTSVSFTGTQQFIIHFEAPQINPPLADFTGSPLNGPEPLSVIFTDATSNTIFRDNYAWSFPGGSPANASGPGPHTVVYNSAGSFDVSLTVANAAGSDTETKESYINAGQPDIVVVPASLNFGLTSILTGKTLPLTIQNAPAASTPLEITAITPPAGMDFSISGVPALPFTLAPGASQVIDVTFAPANEGAQNGDLAIASNDPDENPLAVPLSGIGVSWLSSLTVTAVSAQSNFVPENSDFNLAIGGHTGATGGFDAGLDVPAAPPGFSYYAYFAIAQPVNFLHTDIRGWAPPYETDIDWSLRIVNADGITSEVCWEPGALPAEGNFTLRGTGLNIDMRAQSCAQVAGNAILAIEYRAFVCDTFDFPVAGGAWYLVSLPLIPEDNSLSTLFPGAVVAYEWDYQSQNYFPVSQLEPEKAYWLLLLQAATVEVCGLPLNSYSRSYTAQGWDLTGSVLETSPLMVDPPGSVVAMYGWDPLVQNYMPISPFSVKPTRGYWILVFASCTVTAGSEGVVASGSIAGADDVELAAFYKNYGALPPPPPYPVTQSASTLLPEGYGLSQNYPNPFNPETTIGYQLPEAGRVSLKIYSILGQQVRTLVDGEKLAGFHQVRWDGRNDAGQKMESGIYLYKLETGGFVQSKKTIFLK